MWKYIKGSECVDVYNNNSTPISLGEGVIAGGMGEFEKVFEIFILEKTKFFSMHEQS